MASESRLSSPRRYAAEVRAAIPGTAARLYEFYGAARVPHLDALAT